MVRCFVGWMCGLTENGFVYGQRLIENELCMDAWSVGWTDGVMVG